MHKDTQIVVWLTCHSHFHEIMQMDPNMCELKQKNYRGALYMNLCVTVRTAEPATFSV